MSVPGLFPCLAYRDAPAAIAWIEGALGGRVLSRHDDDSGRVMHAEVAVGEGVVMLGSDGVGLEIAAGTGCVYLVVSPDEIDEHHARAAAPAAKVVRPLDATDYGSRDYVVRDPEGVLWCAGTYRPEAPAAG